MNEKMISLRLSNLHLKWLLINYNYQNLGRCAYIFIALSF